MSGMIVGPRAAQQLRDTVRKSKRLRVSQRGTGSTNNGTNQRLVVKLLSDMPADDPAFQDAAVMELVDGEWVDTEIIRSVRNISDRDLSADTRCIASQVSDLGLCLE